MDSAAAVAAAAKLSREIRASFDSQQPKPSLPPRIRIDEDSSQVTAEVSAAEPPGDTSLCLSDAAKDLSEQDAAEQSPDSRPTLPAIRIVINKQVFSITSASIAISTEGDAADVSISLEVAPSSDANLKRSSSEVVKSIKTSIKSSRRAIIGAASKLFNKQASGNTRSNCEQQQQQHQSAGTADSDQLEVGTDGNLQSVSIEPLPSGGTGTDFGEAMSTEGARRTVSSSQENTIDSDPTQQQQQGTTPDEALPSRDAKKPQTQNFRDLFKFQVKPQPGPVISAVVFPDCVPDKVKAFFEVTQDTKLIATVYAADTSSEIAELGRIKKSLIEDLTRRKVKINGKRRSVWLNPTAGEKVEVWKQYFDRDSRCQMLLGRLPGTYLYGYILPKEIDREKRFDSPEEQVAYERSIRSLAIDQDEYEMEDSTAVGADAAGTSIISRIIDASTEEGAEVYM